MAEEHEHDVITFIIIKSVKKKSQHFNKVYFRRGFYKA